MAFIPVTQLYFGYLYFLRIKRLMFVRFLFHPGYYFRYQFKLLEPRLHWLNNRIIQVSFTSGIQIVYSVQIV